MSSYINKFGAATGIFKSTWLSHRPFLLYFKPTSRCDLRCKICERWKTQSSSEEELSLDEAQNILAKFWSAGARIMTLWGGEPTLRKDLPEILKTAHDMGYITSMCTNCDSLAKKADRLMPHLDTLLCSLDGIGKTHDEFRGIDGLFDRVMSGIKAASAFPGKRIKIWASVHNNSVHQITDLATLARDMKIGIEFFPVVRVPGFNDEIVCDNQALHEAFGTIARLKKEGYPIWNPDRAIETMRGNLPFKCNFGRISVQVDHRGTIHMCEDAAGRPRFEMSNFKDVELIRLFSSKKFKSAVKALENCNICRMPCVMELADNLPMALAAMMARSLSR